jgi:hypothetical protein
MIIRTAIYSVIFAAALAAAPASAAPIAPLPGVSDLAPIETVQRRFGWRDHPLMYGDNYYWHQRQWDAFEGRGGYAQTSRCARFRSYDPATQTYRNRNGRRVRCPR